jgi:hypothetical protein
MEEILTWPGRTYPALAMLLVAAWLVVAGLQAALSARRPKNWPAWALLYLVAFRRTLVGLCLAGAGVAWLADVSWLLAASICIGIGELVESSYYIAVLRWGQHSGAIPSLSQ